MANSYDILCDTVSYIRLVVTTDNLEGLSTASEGFASIISITGLIGGGMGILSAFIVAFFTHRNNKEIEELKSRLENRNHVSKTLFDIELEIYRELSKMAQKVRSQLQLVAALADLPDNGYSALKLFYRRQLKNDGFIMDEDTLLPGIIDEVRNSAESLLDAYRDARNWNAAFLQPAQRAPFAELEGCFEKWLIDGVSGMHVPDYMDIAFDKMSICIRNRLDELANNLATKQR